MAGITKKGVFREKTSPFLKNKMKILKEEKGEKSEEYKALYLQYKTLDIEKTNTAETNIRHWEADIDVGEENHTLRGLERLYYPSLVIEPTMICAAHCRFCLRANYDIFTLDEEELIEVAKFCGSDNVKTEVSEVLISGGDPLIVPKRLNFLVEALFEYAPNIKIIRIGTRLPQHDPNRIDNNVYEIFRKKRKGVRFELATQINHSVELFPEVIDKFNKFRELGIKIYSQNVLLRGVNDNINSLINLYNMMRKLDIEPHYLFHCVPMRGMHHLRTSLQKGLNLAKKLTNSGTISGRVKPMYAVMTDIGKITIYDGVILDKNEKNQILLQSSYKYKERLKWNPKWKLPKTAEVDENGYLRVWYLDGKDN